MPNCDNSKTVLTLDAGGTHFVFSALCGGVPVGDPIRLGACTDDLGRCLDRLLTGFEQLRAAVGRPAAISFAFPGPADYARGVIGDLPNFPAFRGGVPLGPMLERHFGVPVHINNDGNLFALGEALGGLLPETNAALEQHGSQHRYRNLIGVTLGTGLGGGIVVNGQLVFGDNGLGGEMWLLRNSQSPGTCAMECVGRDPLRRLFAQHAGLDPSTVPSPAEIAATADRGDNPHRAAAARAFADFGEVLGAAIADVITLIDGLVVIGGGLAAARRHFMPALLAELRGTFNGDLYGGTPRLAQTILNLDDPDERTQFLEARELTCVVPGTDAPVPCGHTPLLGIGGSRLGTSRAVALGAYATAVRRTTTGNRPPHALRSDG